MIALRQIRTLAPPTVAIFLLLAVGCSTPQSRIRKNPELFASFPEDVQQKVLQGQIDLGFTPDMVLLALGAPGRVYSRLTESGRMEIWAYLQLRREGDIVPIHTTYWYRDRSGRLRLGSDWAWTDAGWYSEHEDLRVEFRDGKVIAIETRGE